MQMGYVKIFIKLLYYHLRNKPFMQLCINRYVNHYVLFRPSSW